MPRYNLLAIIAFAILAIAASSTALLAQDPPVPEDNTCHKDADNCAPDNQERGVHCIRVDVCAKKQGEDDEPPIGG